MTTDTTKSAAVQVGSGVYLPPETAVLRGGKAVGLVAALILALLAFVLNTTAVPPALPAIAREFGIGPAGAGLVGTLFLIAGATVGVGISLYSDYLGRRRTLLLVLTMLLVGTALCVWSPNFVVLLIGRVLQGASSAVFQVTYLLLRERLNPRVFGVALGAAAAINNGLAGGDAFLSGVLVDSLGFRSVFAVILGVTVVAFVAVLIFVPRVEFRTSTGKMDWWGWAVLSIGIVGLTFYLSQGPVDGWFSPLALTYLVITLVAFTSFWFIEKRSTQPLIPVHSLRSRQVWPLLVTTTLTMAAFVSVMGFTIVILSQDPEIGFGMNAATSALLYFTPMALVGTVAAPLSGWIADRIGWIRMLRIGAVLSAASLVFIALSASSPVAIFIGLILLGLGSGGVVQTMVSGLGVDLSPDESPASVPGLNGACFGIGSGLGIAVVAPFVGLASLDGYTIALWIAAAFGIAAIISAQLTRPKVHAG